jgi:hypothetical protein
MQFATPVRGARPEPRVAAASPSSAEELAALPSTSDPAELKAALQRERAACITWQREARTAQEQVRLLDAALQRGGGVRGSVSRAHGYGAASTLYKTPASPGHFLRGLLSPVRGIDGATLSGACTPLLPAASLFDR